MKLLFVLPRLVFGGVERSTLHLIQGFQAKQVTCALALRQSGGELFREAEAVCEVYELAPSSLLEFVPRLSRLINEWCPTHIITAFADVSILTWGAARLASSEAYLVQGIHNSHGLEAARPGRWGRVRFVADSLLSAIAYRQFDALVAVSNGLKVEVVDKFYIPERRVHAIYNPILRTTDIVLHQKTIRRQENEHLRMVAIGRLAHQKGFDLLIEALSVVRLKCEWQLDIWGQGPEEQTLMDLITQYGLRDRIHLRGYTGEPLAALEQADLFIMPSRHEGLGNVLIEAMACGLQVIAADCNYGPREVLENGKLGSLVTPNDIPNLARAIERVAAGDIWTSPELLLDRSRDFLVEHSLLSWHNLLINLASKNSLID